jgi:hypothetical protein
MWHDLHYLHRLSWLDMYNHTNYHSTKASSFSLTNCANLMYMVRGVSFFSLWKSWIFYTQFGGMLPCSKSKTFKKILVGHMVVDHQWLQGTQCSFKNLWYKTYMGTNGSTQAITPKPPMEEFVESSWELVLSLLEFGMALPPTLLPPPCGRSWAPCTMSDIAPQFEFLFEQ